MEDNFGFLGGYQWPKLPHLTFISFSEAHFYSHHKIYHFVILFLHALLATFINLLRSLNLRFVTLDD